MYFPTWKWQNIFSWNATNPFVIKREKTLPSSASISPIELSSKETFRNKENFEKYFLEFSSNGQKVGKIILQVFQDVGPVGECFKDFITMRQGFGYKGSRVYAVHPGEWCLIGDLLFKEWSSEMEESILKPHEGEYVDEYCPQPEEELITTKEKPPRIHEGDHCVPAVTTLYESKAGSLMTVRSSINTNSKSSYEWMVGPQFKVLFVEPVISSGAVFGEVVSGMSCLRRISERAIVNTEPSDRITISDCGIVSSFK